MAFREAIMKTKRALRPVLVILTVFFALNAVWIVARQGIVALIDRLSGTGGATFLSFLRLSSTAELILFTGCTALLLLLSGVLARGRLRAAFFVLAAAWLSPVFLSTLAWVTGGLLTSTAFRQGISAVLIFAGYAILACAARSVRALGWVCGTAAALARLCGAFSTLSASMMDRGDPALWKALFLRTALNIIACVLQAHCFLFLLFSLQHSEGAAASAMSALEPEKQDPAE